MPNSRDLIRTLENLDMSPQDVNLWREYLVQNDTVMQRFGAGEELDVGILRTKYGQPMYKAAETKISNAGQQVATLTWAVPSDGTHLMVMLNASTTRTGAPASSTAIQFNEDTASNYEWQYDIGIGGAQVSANSGNVAFIGVIDIAADNAPANTSGSAVIFIPGYNSSLFKNALCLTGRVDTSTPIGSVSETIYGWWKSTAKIRTVTIFDVNSSNYGIGSEFSLHIIP